MGVLSEIKPEKVFEFFELISSVPRGSSNTKAVSDIVVEFAKERGLECYQDELNNVIIKKPASSGYEEHEPVIIQGHLDMVCAKTEDTRIDMKRQPITLLHDDNYVYADCTTLGADDGIAVAMAIAVLDADDLKHPPIEAVFTVDEETGMDGAKGINAELLKGRVLLNIDSEEEGIFTCGCAGGCGISSELELKRLCDDSGKKVTSDELLRYMHYEVIIDGFLGGHSGVDIDKHRLSATHKLGSVLFEINRECPILLTHIHGGFFDNVIADKATALVAVEPENEELFNSLIEEFNDKIADEYKEDDPDGSLKAVKIDELKLSFSHEPLDRASTDRVLSSIYYLPQGISKMSDTMPGLVQTSSNLGIIRMERNCFKFSASVRSSVKTEKEQLIEEIVDLVDTLDGKSTLHGDYPGWEFKKESKLRDICVEVYKKQYDENPEVVAIHAGLECGLFMEKLDGLDAISFGPDIFDIHTPDEKLSIASTQRVWNMLKGILEKL